MRILLWEIAMTASKHPTEKTKAALHGVKPFAGSQMPFSDQGCLIACVTQMIGQSVLPTRKSQQILTGGIGM